MNSCCECGKILKEKWIRLDCDRWENQARVGGDTMSYYPINEISEMRMAAYARQTQEILRLQPTQVLEVGVGDYVVANLLKQFGIQVTTLDIDEELTPDIVGDVRKMPLEDGSVDVVLASHILEHIPAQEFDKALGEIARVTRKYAVIDLPIVHPYFQFLIHLPFMVGLLKRNHVDLTLRLPRNRGHTGAREHHWEIGSMNITESQVRRHIQDKFRIIREYSPTYNKIHKIYVLEVVE